MAETQTIPVSLLGRGETIVVTPDTHFVASDFFADWHRGGNFDCEFMDVVEDTDGQPVAVDLDPLQTSSLDAPITKEMGGIDTAAIPLSLFAAIAKTGRTFIAYVRKGKAVWGMGCSQSGVKRGVEAYSTENPYEWSAGNEFASRSSSPTV